LWKQSYSDKGIYRKGEFLIPTHETETDVRLRDRKGERRREEKTSGVEDEKVRKKIRREREGRKKEIKRLFRCSHMHHGCPKENTEV
jgi:hypothetical protein